MNYGTSSASGLATNGFNQDFGSGFNLHGLGPQGTLTLINGHRVAPSGSDGQFVDISAIPLSAVERIEILPDGASAIYGSDAIAGVVNIVLKSDFNGAQTQAGGGSATDNGASQYFGSQLIGKSWQSGNAMLAYEYNHQSPLLASQRSYIPDQGGPVDIMPSQTSQSVFLNGQQQLPSDLLLHVDAEYSHRKYSSVSQESLTVGRADRGTAESWAVNAGLQRDLFADWRASLDSTDSERNSPGNSLIPAFDEAINANTRTSVWETVAKADGSLFSIAGNTVKLAIGGSYRSEKLYSTFDESTVSTGSILSDDTQKYDLWNLERIWGTARSIDRTGKRCKRHSPAGDICCRPTRLLQRLWHNSKPKGRISLVASGRNFSKRIIRHVLPSTAARSTRIPPPSSCLRYTRSEVSHRCH